MMTILRPGQEPLEFDYILIDFEGTLAQDHRVHPKAKDKINLLAKRAKIYILTKGEKERVEEALRRVKAEITFLNEGEAAKQKLDLLLNLGAPRAVVIGNGMDDAPMMKEAGLSMAVIGKEGTSGELIQTADLIFPHIVDALDFLLKPLRQKATLGC
jgi:soluble P-type ATPase